MWTRLLYLDLNKAFQANVKNGRYLGPQVSNRYKAMLKKQFKINQVPWIYETPKDDAKNPRHKTPKGHKCDNLKPIRLMKIKKALENTAEAELKYRQERLNKRKLSGFDYIITQTAPSWVNPKRDPNKEENQ